MNVLVIEDDNGIASLVARALTEDGHSVSVSHNGRETTREQLIEAGWGITADVKEKYPGCLYPRSAVEARRPVR